MYLCYCSHDNTSIRAQSPTHHALANGGKGEGRGHMYDGQENYLNVCVQNKKERMYFYDSDKEF